MAPSPAFEPRADFPVRLDGRQERALIAALCVNQEPVSPVMSQLRRRCALATPHLWPPERMIGKLINLLARPFQFRPAIDVGQVVGIALAFQEKCHHVLRAHGLFGSVRQFLRRLGEDFIFAAQDFKRHLAPVPAELRFVKGFCCFHPPVLRDARPCIAPVWAQLAL